jgi:hypothetical protein
VSEAFGEATCGTATPDVTVAGPEHMEPSPDENYNHTQCAHTFV